MFLSFFFLFFCHFDFCFVISELNDVIVHPEGSYTELEHLLMRLGLVTEIRPHATAEYDEKALWKAVGKEEEAQDKARRCEMKRRYVFDSSHIVFLSALVLHIYMYIYIYLKREISPYYKSLRTRKMSPYKYGSFRREQQ